MSPRRAAIGRPQSWVLLVAAAIVFAPAHPAREGGSSRTPTQADIAARILAPTFDTGEVQGGPWRPQLRGGDLRWGSDDRAEHVGWAVLACLVGLALSYATGRVFQGLLRCLRVALLAARAGRAPPELQLI